MSLEDKEFYSLREAVKLALDAIQTYSPEYMHGLPKEKYVNALRAALATVPSDCPDSHQPQREPLTDEAVQQLYAACLTSTHHIKDLHGGAFGWLVRIIERVHGIGGKYER